MSKRVENKHLQQTRTGNISKNLDLKVPPNSFTNEKVGDLCETGMESTMTLSDRLKQMNLQGFKASSRSTFGKFRGQRSTTTTNIKLSHEGVDGANLSKNFSSLNVFGIKRIKNKFSPEIQSVLADDVKDSVICRQNKRIRSEVASPANYQTRGGGDPFSGRAAFNQISKKITKNLRCWI